MKNHECSEKEIRMYACECFMKKIERLERLERHLRIKISEFIAKSRDYPMTATNNRYDEIVKSLQEILE